MRLANAHSVFLRQPTTTTLYPVDRVLSNAAQGARHGALVLLDRIVLSSGVRPAHSFHNLAVFVLLRSGLSTGTGVSSVWILLALIIYLRIASAGGCSRAAQPATQFTIVERSISTPSCIDLALPVQQQVIPVFAHRHMGQQARAGWATLNGATRCRCLPGDLQMRPRRVRLTAVTTESSQKTNNTESSESPDGKLLQSIADGS